VDGIRVFHVTGVQTCALPILFDSGDEAVPTHTFIEVEGPRGAKQLLEVYTPTSCVSMLWVSVCPEAGVASYDVAIPDVPSGRRRSGERRAGRGCRSVRVAHGR